MSPAAEHEPSPRRVVTPVTSLAGLVGGHPDAIRRIFGAGRPTDPAELGDAPQGKLLALAHGGEVFLALRPLLRLGDGVLPWQGKTFDHGGNSGQNVVLGRRVLRFRAEGGPSLVDGLPALVLTYDAPAYENPWPVRTLRDELRTVGAGIAVGAVIAVGLGGGSPVTLAWFGLEAVRHA
jgi:hypothetical protein